VVTEPFDLDFERERIEGVSSSRSHLYQKNWNLRVEQ
jgi:hypothetical protein